MPHSVRAARAIIVVMAAIGVSGTVAWAALGNSYAAGGNVVGYFFFWMLAITACFFGSGRGGVRVAATVFAVLEALVGLGSAAFDTGVTHPGPTGPGPFFVRLSPGPIGSVAAIVVIVLLYRASAGRWFRRPTTIAGARGDVANHGATLSNPTSATHSVQATEGTADNGVYCAYCGATPAARVDFRGHRGLLIVMQFRRQPGPFCRDCGLATYRRMTVDSAWLGWWGLLSVVINPTTMLINLPARATVAALAPPAPGSPRQPMDPGKPLLHRPAALGLLIPVTIVASIVTAVALPAVARDRRGLSVGDCVATTDGTRMSWSASQLMKLDCAEPHAQARVVARLDGTEDTSGCLRYEESGRSYVISEGSTTFVLCLHML
ncbi:hypothetical protein BJY24_005023 [Nocardia transvalensis]|uniref:Uncharacterized protein n=2 Tax=Nocardia transvalensis TaxID=37333 RepID=A0A7W9UK60_9NOCA|nr:hypothetical protein [Nocardia transvalensis]MBB5916111.1 hypothetical protein [Nocardia transvalensis]